MSFKDQSWATRYAGLGDIAESKFESVYKTGFTRFGLDRPPYKLSVIPARLRGRPDYETASFFVEVVGFGKDQLLKIRIEKMQVMSFWHHQVFPVEFFIYDSFNDRYVFRGLRQLDELVNKGKVQLGQFPEGKAYFAFSAKDLFGE